MNEVRVSVITVTRNDKVGLIETTESLNRQDYPHLQHVVIDGASEDGSASWLEAYRPKCDLYWSSEPDGGIFDAMNKGVSKSDGSLIVFMNSGDVFFDSHVISLVAEKWRQSRFLWGYGGMRYMDDRGAILGVTKQSRHRQRRLELGTTFAPHQATYVDRTFFNELGGFDVDFSFAADQEFAIRAGRRCSPEVWTEYSADFLLGGVHGQSSYWIRERLYHRMRVKNARCVLGSISADRAYAEVMAAYREARQGTARLLRRVGRMKSGRTA